MALLALLPGLSDIVYSVAGGAIRRLNFRSRHHQFPVFTFEELGPLSRVASTAKRWNLIRRGDSIGRDGPGGAAMLHAGSMAGVAAQSFLKMPMTLEVGDLLGMAGDAEFVSLLRQQGKRTT